MTTFHALAYGRWIVDDAGITFAYARAVTSGFGPVLQPGAEPVEGYSNPAWLLVLAAGRAVGLFDRGAWFGVPDYVLFPKGVALLCCAGVFLAAYRAAAAVCRRPALVAAVAGVAVALTPSFVIWCFSGLENSLLALAVAWLATVLVRAATTGRLLCPRVAVACGLLAALAALTRPEGLVYVVAHPLVAAVFLRRETLPRTTTSVALSVSAFAVPVVGYLAWRWATFHAMLPNTAMAKAQTAPSVARVHRGIELIGYAGWPLVLICAGCVGAVLTRPSPARRALVVLAVPLGLAAFAYIVLVRDWMGALRFATPVWPLAALTAAIAVEAMAHRTAVRGRAVLAVCTVTACAITALTWQKDIARASRGPTVPLCVVADQSRAYNEYARILGGRDASVLLPDIGGTALTSRLRVVDVAGLADRRVAEYWSDRDMAGLRDHVFGRLRPTIIHVHGGWATRTGLLADSRMDADYVVVHRYSSTGVDLVRRDAVDRPRTLTELRAAAHRSATRQAELGAAPRRSCGSTLR
ncbi:MAG: hypothetical protein ACRDSK_00970 [Actinophytocola sp.]|uniref:hypothetical protein n=1 Tax=Actinophytocola sp. TaxID=1872138 RepID=UPI003D6C36A6